MKTNQTVYIHPSSGLFQQTPPPKAVLYYELVQTSKSYLRRVVLLSFVVYQRLIQSSIGKSWK